jgi:hypothetical protein
MLRKPIAACLIAWTITVAPAMAQTPPPGPTPATPQTGPAGAGAGGAAQTTAPGTNTQGQVVGTPQTPGSTEAQRGASLVPLVWVCLIALGAAAAFWYVRRRRGGRS